MAATNEDFGRVVTEAIRWLGYTPIVASRELGIKPATMNAMCSGIVPMRSLVIRFAAEVGRRADDRGGAPSWWTDVDAWLALAGYPPRREILVRARAPRPSPGAGEPAARGEPAAAIAATSPAGEREARGRPQDPAVGEPAHRHYQPRYERVQWGDTHFHIFWLLDPNQRKTHQFRYPADVDYVRRADRLKHDLATLSKGVFERRYAAYRLETEP